MMTRDNGPNTDRMNASTAPGRALAGTICERFPRLAKLPPGALQEIVREGKYLVLPAGTRVFDERGPCGAFPLVLRGAIRVFKQAPSGRQLLLYRVKSGELCVLTELSTQ